MKKIEQIDSSGRVVLDNDDILDSDKKFSVLQSSFENLKKEKGHFTFTFKDKTCDLFVKNITYLGHPHPIYKKRIQVPINWGDDLLKNTSFLMGIYHYKGNVVFVVFSKKRRGKSSSAHVSTIDILKGIEFGVFRKIDKNNNEIVVFTKENIHKVFGSMISDAKISNNEEIEVIDKFSEDLEKEWHGIDAYTKMMEANFSQAFQAEWPGFYLEYKFEDFLNSNKEYLNICKYIREKGAKSLDFDVRFVKSDFLGDLKTHDFKSSAILGNDKISFLNAIEQYNKIWYIVLEVDSSKDRDNGFKTSDFWRRKIIELKGLDKKEGSYANRMKHSVLLKQIFILEINKFNQKYVSDFRQGKNPNGNERELKIQIKKRDIDNFVIFRKILNN